MTASREKFSWLQATIIALILISLCLAALYLLRTLGEIQIQSLLTLPWLPLALALQVLASCLFILAWQRWLQLAGPFSLAECTAHIGVTLLGKYIPGKIWGLLGRTMLLQRRGINLQTALDLLLADQFITFYTGVVIGCLALLGFVNAYLAVAGLCLAALLTFIMYNNYPRILNWTWRHMAFLAKRLGKDFHPEATRINRSSLYSVSGIYVMHWLITALVLGVLFTPAIDSVLPEFYLLLIAAIPLAMLAGFLALWAPGGVGVREAIIIAVLSLQLDWELAAAIAISYRMICILIDLVIGALAFRYFAGNAAELLRNDN